VDPTIRHGSGKDSAFEKSASASASIRHIGACIDRSVAADRILPHAVAVARAFDSAVTVLHALEPEHYEGKPVPTDPLEWEIRRAEARRHLEGLSSEHGTQALSVVTELLEGRPAEEICDWIADHEVDLTVLCSHGASGWTDWSLASTAKKLIEGVRGSVLLIPAWSVREPPAREIVCADLVLVHAVPAPELMSPEPAAEEDLEIEQRLVARNTRGAQAYLGHLRDRLADAEMNVRTLLYGSGDVRVQLLRCITEEHASLVVLSAHGRTGRTEIPFGTIAGHLVEHGTVPLLIVREPVVGQKRATQTRHTSASVRLPPLATA